MSASVTTSPRRAATLVLLVASATIAGALASQHLFGLVPCKLCLQQRWPYYVGVPLAAVAALAPPAWSRVGLGLLALVFLVSAGLGGYHAGVEWGLFQGPSDCAGGAGPSGTVDDLLRGLESERIVGCTQAAWRFAGLSLAGWNAIVSLGLTGLCAAAALRARGRW